MVTLDSFIEKIKTLEQNWASLSSVPDNLFGSYQDLTKNDVLSFLVRLRLQLEHAIDSNQHVNPIYYQQISTQLTNLETYINQHLPSNPTAHLPGFFNILYATSLVIDQSVLLISSDKESLTSNFSNKLKDKLTESIAKASVVNKLLENTEKLISNNKTISDELSKSVLSSQEATIKIQERDRTTAELTNRITETEKKSSVLFTELEGNLKKVGESSKEIEEQQENLKQISETLQNKLNEAQQLLEDTNRHGLAGAFKTRKKELFWPSIGWIVLFLMSISALIYLGNLTLEKSGTDWHQLLLHLPLTAPFIWLGWFSVRQFGFNKKLQEDYAFKVASAMSFQGYKNEVGDDQEMLNLLRKSAIENFSSNPLRIYNEGNNHGSPLHELIDNVSDDKLSKILDVVKALVPKR